MGTITTDEVWTDEVQGEPGSGSIIIGSAVFPASDSTPRSVASFGNTSSFVARSAYQSVVSSTATVQASTTVVGVNFDGPVVLDFAGNIEAAEISVVDEGGFCSPVNSITAVSSGAIGSLVLSSSYSHLRIRKLSESVLVSEVRSN